MKKFLLSVAAVAMAFSASAEVSLVGGFNEWDAANGLSFEEKEGLWTLSVESLLPDFKIVEDGKWLGSETPLTLGEALTLGDTGMGGNIVFADTKLKAVANATLTFDSETKALTVTGEAGDATITYAIHGTMINPDWESYDMTDDNGTWYYTFENLAVESANFGIKELTDGSQTAWFSAPKDAAYVTITGAAKDLLCATTDNTNFAISGLNGTYTFYFTPATLMLTVEEGAPAAINTVEAADNAPVVYYNLAGVRVDNPANGLFIKKQGNVATKVLVK